LPGGLQLGNLTLSCSKDLFMSFILALSRSQADFLYCSINTFWNSWSFQILQISQKKIPLFDSSSNRFAPVFPSRATISMASKDINFCHALNKLTSSGLSWLMRDPLYQNRMWLGRLGNRWWWWQKQLWVWPRWHGLGVT